MNPSPESPSLCPVAQGTLCLILVRGLKAPDDQSKAEGAKGFPLSPPLTESGGPFYEQHPPSYVTMMAPVMKICKATGKEVKMTWKHI